MKHFLLNITQIKLPFGIALLLLCGVCWVRSIMAEPLLTSVTMSLAVVNAVLLMRLCYKTNMTRTMSFMPVVMYMLPFSALPWLHQCWQGQVACMALLLSDIQLLGTYRMDNAAGEALLSTLLILAGSLFCAEMIFIVPLLWVFFMVQQSFNLKVFISSLIAVAVVVIYAGIVLWLQPELPRISPVTALTGRELLPLPQGILVIVMVVTVLTFLVFALLNFSQENVTTQTYITFSGIPLLAIITFTVWQSAGHGALCLLLLTLAMLATHFFLYKQTLPRGITFIAYLLVFFSYHILLATNIL